MGRFRLQALQMIVSSSSLTWARGRFSPGDEYVPRRFPIPGTDRAEPTAAVLYAFDEDQRDDNVFGDELTDDEALLVRAAPAKRFVMRVARHSAVAFPSMPR